MSTMVTGGLGYVGRHLVADLAGRGETVVSYNRDYAEGTEENVVYVQGELYDLPRFVDTLRRHESGASSTPPPCPTRTSPSTCPSRRSRPTSTDGARPPRPPAWSASGA